MPKNNIMTLLFTVLFTAFAFSFATVGAAGDVSPACPVAPCGNNYPCDIDTFDTFVNNMEVDDDCPKPFNPLETSDGDVYCEDISSIDFKGQWYVVAIAHEAAHRIQAIHEGRVIFDSNDCWRWGLYSLVDFDTGNLIFHDVTDSKSYPLDPYTFDPDPGGFNRFRVCKLVKDSETLDYLTIPTKLFKEDYIVGFEDLTDKDNADLIVAMRPLKSSEDPRYDPVVTESDITFDGLGFSYEWLDRTTCDVIVRDEYGNIIDGTPLTDIVDSDFPSDPAVFFGVAGADCKVVYLKFGEESTRCPIIRGKKYCR